MQKIIDRSICSKCKKNPPHRKYWCKECEREYSRLAARKRYERDFKAEPHEYKQYVKSTAWLRIEKDIRPTSDIRKSLSAKFGAQPNQKYDANHIRMTKGEYHG